MALIPQSFISDLLNRVDIVDVVGIVDMVVYMMPDMVFDMMFDNSYSYQILCNYSYYLYK